MLLKKDLLKYFFIVLAIRGGVFAQGDCLLRSRAFSNIDSSISCIETCVSCGIMDTAAYVNTICHLSDLYNKKSLYVRSEKRLFGLIPLLQPKLRKVLLGRVYNQLANTYKLSKQVALALKYYLESIKIFEAEKSPSDLVKVYTDMAEYNRSVAHFDEARNYIKKAIDTYTRSKVNDIPKLIRVYNRYAAILNESSDSDSCLIFSLKALNLSRQIGDLNSEATSLNEIGYAMKNRRHVDSSMKCYKKAVELWTKTGADADAAHGIFNMASLMSHNFFPKKEIIPYYESIIRRVKEKKVDYPLDQVYFELSNCYFFLGDSLTCYKIRQDYFSALIQQKQKIFDAEVSNIREKYENEKYKKEISKVSGELEVTEKNLDQKKQENLIIYLSLGILIILMITIGFLAKKINSTNKTLKVKNREKDSLIQEIHHRVKNNLQFVSSLINMQINSSKTSLEVDSLSDASRRIRSMALVHEMLYNQDDLSGIEIKKYLTELISSINDIVNSKKIPIRFNLDCEVMMFESSKAIALGMITSELVSNSIKYAFSETTEPRIDISLHKMDSLGNISFTVRDNGKGLKAESQEVPEKLGMRLINIFSRQMKGEYTFNNNNGLVYTLVFKETGKNGKSESTDS
ncbi:MAG: tetratricopeptide repeat-containing sensor histidine kinase [Bacteroidia bacterium]